jgi:acyl dehydratase
LFPKITDEALDALRRRVDVRIENTLEPWCHEATRDAIRHYAHGIGDDNPLWCDPDYAANTRWGGIVALPSFLFATSRIISGYVGGLPGVHAMWAGAEWTWHLPVRRNDAISTEAWLKELIERETRFAGRSIQQVYHVDFHNQRGEMVASADSWGFRTDRDQAREQGSKYDAVKARPPPHYSDADLERIYQLYAEEKVRGPVPLYWNDVAVGDRLPTMVKGPMTVTGFIAYAQGWGGLYIRANKLAWKQIHAHRGLGIANRFGIPDCPERVHWEPEFARMVGVPGAYDYGPERCSWLTHHLTNWMGDDGTLRRASCKIRRHNPEGDTLFIKGTVVRSFVEDGRHLIEIAQEAHNQDDELSVVGSGVVELPVRRLVDGGGGRWTRPLPPTPCRKGRGSGFNIRFSPPCGRGVGEGGQTPPKPATSRVRISRQSAASACRSLSPADPAASRATSRASVRRAP